MSEAGVKRINLKSINTESANILIVGVIIAKRSAKTFNSRKGNNFTA